MPSRGRHQSSSKECLRLLRRIEGMDDVLAVIIGRSYGGKSLGQGLATGSIRIQRTLDGGIKAVTQTEKGLQEIYIRTAAGTEECVALEIRRF